ncbi:MAG: hypothetical protein AAF633_20755, partial [Chloroflexota bacterium]
EPSPTPTLTPIPQTCSVPESEPNDTFRQIPGPMIDCPEVVIEGTFTNDSVEANGNYYDSYLFVMETAGSVTIGLSNVPAGHNYDLFIRERVPVGVDAFNEESETGQRGEGEQLSYPNLPAGQYYISVENADIDAGASDQPYRLTIRKN